MKKIMIMMVSGLMVLGFLLPVQATTLDLSSWALNENGTVSGGGSSDSPFGSGNSLGSFTWTTSSQGVNYVGAFFDIEIYEENNTYFNEYGAAIGIAPTGLSWEIDEPGYHSSSLGDIWTNFDGTLGLDNANGVFASKDKEDVSFALAWDFVLGDNEEATVTWTITDTDPGLSNVGFYLTQSDPGGTVKNLDPVTLYFYSALDIESTGGGSEPVPEPATILLFGLGILGLAGLGRRKAE